MMRCFTLLCSALLVMAVRAATGTDDALLLNMTDNIRVSFTQHGLNEVVDLGTELVCVLRFSGVVVSSLCASSTLQSTNLDMLLMRQTPMCLS